MERIDKILSNSGIGTRKEVKQLIKNSVVKIDGVTVKSPDTKVDASCSVITVNDTPVIYKKYIYLMLNKPQGYVSATEDNVYPTVTELVPLEYLHYNVFPVGRLDVDTEGLLILTNDGKFAHNVASPKKHIEKEYFVVPENDISEEDTAIFSKPMNLGDFTTMPALLKKCDNGCCVTIHEGKFHQVKRMFEKINNSVVFLKRIRIGGLMLDDNLDLGETKELSEGDLELIWK